MRADARQNRERLLAAAKLVFAEDADASLNKIAQRAGVGPGTLYRHFPTLHDLLVAIVGEDIEALCATGRELLTHPSPGEALRIWLRAVAVHASTLRGLLAAQLAALPTDAGRGALAAGHESIRATGSALLARAQHAGQAAGDVDISDLLRLVNAIAWASEQVPDDPDLLDRLLALVNPLPRH